jgi:hypothetical protein
MGPKMELWWTPNTMYNSKLLDSLTGSEWAIFYQRKKIFLTEIEYSSVTISFMLLSLWQLTSAHECRAKFASWSQDGFYLPGILFSFGDIVLESLWTFWTMRNVLFRKRRSHQVRHCIAVVFSDPDPVDLCLNDLLNYVYGYLLILSKTQGKF